MDKLEKIKFEFDKYENNFSLTSEDVDWLINRVEKLEKERNELFEDKEMWIEGSIQQHKQIKDYEQSLREINNHIMSTPEPIPYIINTLKKILPEYK